MMCKTKFNRNGEEEPCRYWGSWAYDYLCSYCYRRWEPEKTQLLLKASLCDEGCSLFFHKIPREITFCVLSFLTDDYIDFTLHPSPGTFVPPLFTRKRILKELKEFHSDPSSEHCGYTWGPLNDDTTFLQGSIFGPVRFSQCLLRAYTPKGSHSIRRWNFFS